MQWDSCPILRHFDPSFLRIKGVGQTVLVHFQFVQVACWLYTVAWVLAKSLSTSGSADAVIVGYAD